MPGLTARQLNSYVLSKQHAVERISDPLTAINAAAGLHGQLPTSALAGLQARCDGIEKADFNRLVESKRIVRVTAMRNTLFYVDSDFLPTVLAVPAWSRDSDYAIDYAQRQFCLKPADVDRSFEAVLAFLEDGSATRQEIYKGADFPAKASKESKSYLVRRLSRRRRIALTIKDGVEHYALFDKLYKRTALPIDAAAAKLAEAYFKAYGPATERDFIWWAGGLGATRARAAMATLDLETIVSKAFPGLLCMPGEADALAAHRPARFTVELPKLDGFMMGYKERKRFGADAATLYDRAGNSNPVVVKDGRISQAEK